MNAPQPFISQSDSWSCWNGRQPIRATYLRNRKGVVRLSEDKDGLIKAVWCLNHDILKTSDFQRKFGSGPFG